MTPTPPVDEGLAGRKLFTLVLRHVFVMYAGAVAMPLIVGRALKLEPADVAFLISADLFVCGLVTLILSMGATQWFGIKLPDMIGVTFAAVGPPVVTGTIILIIGVSLMHIGIDRSFDNPVGPTAPQAVDPAHADRLKAVTDAAAAGTTGIPEIPPASPLRPSSPTPPTLPRATSRCPPSC